MNCDAGPSRDRGQAAVELALCLPLLFIFLLGIVQLVVIVRDQLAVQLAAREAARAAAVAASSAAAARGALPIEPSRCDPGRVAISRRPTP